MNLTVKLKSSKLLREKKFLLTAVADYEILRSLLDAEDTELGDRLESMKTAHQAMVRTEAVSVVSKSRSMRSSLSVSVAKSRIESAELDIDLETRHEQETYDQQIRELEARAAAIKLQRDTALIKSRQKKLVVRDEVLQEYDVDKRNDVIDALEQHATPRVQSVVQPEVRHVQITPASPAVSVVRPPASHISTKSDVEVIGDSIAKAMRASRYAAPEPPVYTGNPLEYIDWEVSFRDLIEIGGILERDRIPYLKRYVSGRAKEAISGFSLLSSKTAYEQARKILKERFGSPHAIAQAFKVQLSQWPKFKSSDPVGLQRFSDLLMQCVAAKEQVPGLSMLDDTSQTLDTRVADE